MKTAEEGLTAFTGQNTERVIPYVQDRKNCLLIEPKLQTALDPQQVYTFQTAFKQAVQQLFQLEDFELSSETMPSGGEPRSILVVESAEGGAGVLRRLVDNSDAIGSVARRALEICHFDPDTGADLKKARHAKEECVQACYDCLLNYGNQRIHDQLNRHSIKDFLLLLRDAVPRVVQSGSTTDDPFTNLLKLCDSELEKTWLTFVRDNGFRLPSAAQHYLDCCSTRADFFYAPDKIIYIDGPVHDYDDVAARDNAIDVCLEEQGLTVLRFTDREQWLTKLNAHPAIFGRKK